MSTWSNNNSLNLGLKITYQRWCCWMFRSCPDLQNWREKKISEAFSFISAPTTHSLPPSPLSFLSSSNCKHFLFGLGNFSVAIFLFNPFWLPYSQQRKSPLKTLSDYLTSPKSSPVLCGLRTVMKSPWLSIWGPLGVVSSGPLPSLATRLPPWCLPCFASCLVLNVGLKDVCRGWRISGLTCLMCCRTLIKPFIHFSQVQFPGFYN